ncbi:MAG: tyrosine-type recombinase/integrase [Synechococcus sp.]
MAKSDEKIPPVVLKSLNGDHRSSTDNSPPDIRWLGIDEFLKAKSLAPNTENAYRCELRRFLSWCDKPWFQVGIKDLTRYKSYLIEQQLKASSRNRVLAALKSFFGWFFRAYPVERAQLATSAVSLEKLPKLPPFDLNTEEVQALREAVKYRGVTLWRDRALLAVLEHGLRAGYVSLLDVGDYDGTRLDICQAKDDSTGKVPLLPQATVMLDEYLEWREQKEELTDELPLFVTLIPGRPTHRLSYQGIRNVIR